MQHEIDLAEHATMYRNDMDCNRPHNGYLLTHGDARHDNTEQGFNVTRSAQGRLARERPFQHLDGLPDISRHGLSVCNAQQDLHTNWFIYNYSHRAIYRDSPEGIRTHATHQQFGQVDTPSNAYIDEHTHTHTELRCVHISSQDHREASAHYIREYVQLHAKHN